MTTTASYIFTDDSLSLSINNVPYNVSKDHGNWDAIMEALKLRNYDAIPGLINEVIAVQQYIDETAGEEYLNIKVDVENGIITYAGRSVDNVLVDHIFKMKAEGFAIAPMLRFLDNLFDNPSKRAVEELYGFMQYGKMPITDDGYFIAYKRVKDNYRSVHNSKTINTPYHLMTAEDKALMPYTYNGTTTSIVDGVTVVHMPRNAVNENSEQTCSDGLHFCSHEYLKSFSGSRILILKVNPRDVVSIPTDYNNTKGRACCYQIIGELTEELKERAEETNVFTEAVHNGINESKAKVPAVKEPKRGVSSFYRGYHDGYNGHQCVEPETPYLQGFEKGMKAKLSGEPAAYVFDYEDGEGEEPSKPFLSVVVEAVMPAGYPKIGVTSFYRGYDAGYDAGYEDKPYKAASSVDGRFKNKVKNKNIRDYNQGYEKGYRAAKNGLPRLYILPSVVKTADYISAVITSGYDEVWQRGYEDGYNSRLKNGHFTYDDSYNAGYTAGTTARYKR